MNELFDKILNVDVSLFLFLNNLNVPRFVDGFFCTITNVTFLAIIGVVLLFVLAFAFKKKSILMILILLVAVAVSDYSGAQMKRASKVMRPCHPELNVSGKFLIGRKTSSSFPSNHAINWGVISFFIFFLLRRENRYRAFRNALLVFGALVAYSRIAVGVHFPIDVTFGFLYGILSAMIFFTFYKFLDMRINK